MDGRPRSDEQEHWMFERFTNRTRRALELAHEEARLLNHTFVGSEHLLLGLISEGEGVAGKTLHALGISLEAVRERVEAAIGPAAAFSAGGSLPFTPDAKKVLELSLREALQLGHNYIGTEHVLLGIVREGECLAARVLIELGPDLWVVRQRVVQLLSGYAVRPHYPEPASGGSRREALVDLGPGVSAVAVPIDPSALVTWNDVEDVLRSAAAVRSAHVTTWDSDGVAHRSCDYEPAAPPTITVTVAGAHISAEAFERTTAYGNPERLDDIGDAAIYDAVTSSLLVFKGSVAFSVAVHGHWDSRAVASALARKGAERLDGAV
jgi:hypothetical protein